MITETLCAICQNPSNQIVCDFCESRWGHTATWVQDLSALEQHYRDVISDDEDMVVFHIDTVGHVYDEKNIISSAHSVENPVFQIQEGVWESPVLDIYLWAERGGLTPAQCHAFELMWIGLTGPEAISVINEIEHKHITSKAYHRRMEEAIKKIRRVFSQKAEFLGQ